MLPDYNAPSALAAVLDEHGFGMQKKFGQNFLINAHIRQGLVSALGLSAGIPCGKWGRDSVQ